MVTKGGDLEGGEVDEDRTNVQFKTQKYSM